MSSPDEIARWFQRERGITRETLRAFGVTVDGTNVLFPYPNGTKQRPDPTKPIPAEGRRFYFTKGKVPDLFSAPVIPQQSAAFLVEGETDTMRLWQELGGEYPVFGIGGINTWHEGLAHKLAKYDRVHVILDNDSDYMVTHQVDEAWRKIRHGLPNAKRVYLPDSVKDVCEFFELFDLESLLMLTQRLAVSRFEAVDFTIPPPPVDWIVDGLIARGDVTVLAGLGGLGKSWVTMAAALAVLRGDKQLFGQGVEASGNVLYVDEENPIDVVHERMKRLGLDPTGHAGNLRYLWNQHIRLDKHPEILLDESHDFRPVFTVLDSLTRLHSKDENSSGEMGELFNEGIKPLARETGTGVCLIHHQDKSASGPRGSTDIENAADAVIQVYGQGSANPGKFKMRVTKSRRRLGGKEIVVGIVDNPDGTASLVADPIINPPF